MSLTKVTKGQNFRCGFFEVDPLTRLKQIKQAGFDETMFWWGTEFEDTDGSRFDLFDNAVKIGLSVSTCHFPSTHADWLWYEQEGKEYVKQFDQACAECGERGVKYLVIHLTRKLVTPPPNQTGADNFARMLDGANKHGVVMAVENTRFLNYNDFIVSRFKGNPALGFCFDSGHANCYTPSESPLERYSDMLVTTHIHDNLGPVGAEPDQHHVMGEGTVNFSRIFDLLKKFDAKHINLESYCNPTSRYYGKLSLQQFLQMSFDRLTEQMKKSGIE